jgi:hypothetical protein
MGAWRLAGKGDEAQVSAETARLKSTQKAARVESAA